MSRALTALIAEDDRRMAELLAELAAAQGFQARIASTGAEAVAVLERGEADALFTDLRLPPPGGLELLQISRQAAPEVPVVLITGHATLQVAVDAFRSGLFDLITKPFETAQVRALMARVRLLLDHRARVETLSAQLSRLTQGDCTPVIASPAASQVHALIEQVAPLDVPVLLTGETGTGKSLMARFIHERGARCSGPFFGLSCATIASGLIESELFGYEPGAFTGATGRKRGLLELADGGTLFLDEINSAGRKLQARLLQFIQERTVLRLGGSRPVAVDVRLIFASNQPLPSLVEQGLFRQDLYYRINVFPVSLPPLRERRDDILPLAEQMLVKHAREMARPARRFTEDAIAQLKAYTWPGNIRELDNLVQRAVVLCAGVSVGVEHLPSDLRPAPMRDVAQIPTLPLDATLDEVERFWIGHTLQRCGGNKAEAARRLGIDVTTLYRKLKD
jgi:DNA-binding NtrC family response regulator